MVDLRPKYPSKMILLLFIWTPISLVLALSNFPLNIIGLIMLVFGAFTVGEEYQKKKHNHGVII